MEENREQEVDLQHYLRVLFKWRWVACILFALVVFFTTIYNFTTTPLYESSARLLIEKENPNLVSIQEVMAVDASGQDYYQTQYQIIQSRAVARAVIERLDLASSEEFFPKPKDHFIAQFHHWMKQSIADAKQWATALLKTPDDRSMAEDASEADSALVSSFINRITVSPIRNSRLVDVSVQAKDPKQSARMANALVRAYIDQNLEAKLGAAKDGVKWLGERMEEERTKVETAEFALLKYKEENQIITDFSSDVEMITAQKIAQINTQVLEAESARVEAETRYQQALALEQSPEMLDSIPEVLSNDIVKQIKKMEVDLYNRMSELSNKYGRNHPQMQAIESELADLKKRKITEARRVVSSLKNQYKLALARESSLKEALERQKSENLLLNKKAIQFSVLKRQAESARQMYELLVKRFKETSLTEEMKTGNIRVVDHAEVPKYPVSPNKKRNTLLAVVIGLMLGVGAAFLLDYLDNTIKLPEEIKEHLDIAYLGPIPAFTPRENPDDIPEDLVALHSPKSTASESFRGIRTGILFSSADIAPHVILVTSAGPGEGKTVCAANLAIAMAQSGSRVVVLDCDMRRPRAHKVFNVSREIGLSNVLVGSGSLKDAIVPTQVENLDLIPSGPIPPNPSELLGSKRMQLILAALRKKYNRIIIDTPPITAVTDAVVMAQAVDGVVLVIRAGETPRQLVQNGLAQLQSSKAHILGAVLNGVHTGRDSYYYYQYYYYYYGEDGQKQKKTRQKKKHKGTYA
ncbi:MAG: polysaccharide biosynthesis tyrosine autokinase [Lentisphaeria bacterium]|nr:polysaccharide biosynthesis tyrosine autokinase [Lentisphaeria bacterium]